MILKKIVKAFVYNALNYSGYLKARDAYLYSRGKTWCTILLYHRVDENISNDPVDINISPDEFRKQIKAFSESYNVLTIAQILQHLKESKPFPPKSICITFDDSYESIYRNALPILKEYDVPASFFINDGYLETDRTYPWDEVIEYKQPMMSWAHVKEIVDDGFEVGVHTTNHLDLGACDYETASMEIGGSRKILENGLGLNLPYFSIPFGRRNSYKQETIDIVKDNGFSCCFSAYGGHVDMDSDPYNLERMPFSSDYSSIAELKSDLDHIF